MTQDVPEQALAAATAIEERRAAPVLALGTFERVGSNWLSDSLRAVMPQHNEPFRQQLGHQHQLSALNPLPDPDTDLDGLARHHLLCALHDLHGQPRHLVKETNLFFTTAAVLRLLPDSPVLVLTRAPVGIASSFARGRLWERWRYGQRYRQLAQVAQLPGWRDYAPLLPPDDPTEPVGLARLLTVNALLLAQALAHDPAGRGKTYAHLAYERHVTEPGQVLAGLADYLDLDLDLDVDLALPAAGQAAAPAPGSADADTTFATNQRKDNLVAELDQRTAALIRQHVAATLARARGHLDTQVCDTAAHWLAGDDQYQLRAPVTRTRTARPPAADARVPVAAYRHRGRVSWRNTLVTNAEMAELLTALHTAGAPNTRNGVNLLLCPMPHERGGRIHFDPQRRAWRVSHGYEAHPAYWVTWAGAAARAAWSGARLPTRAEALQAATGAPLVYNCDYRVGDTCPVAEPGRGPGQVHHMVGNLQIWCGDGPLRTDAEPAQRYLIGAAWNTPGDWESVAAVRSRYLLGSSRGVGVRLVRDRDTTEATALGSWELAERINRWTRALEEKGRSAGELDRLLVTELAGPAPAAGS